ncbi:MAG: hypothetical protein IJ685_08675 [Selenomonadaceae bacterium]|nr:hypothetical protein [Selenomonadaceae bacterium]
MSTIKIISVGWGALNALNHMIDSGLTGADFIACTGSKYSLQMSKAPKKIWLTDGKE